MFFGLLPLKALSHLIPLELPLGRLRVQKLLATHLDQKKKKKRGLVNRGGGRAKTRWCTHEMKHTRTHWESVTEKNASGVEYFA